MTRNRTVIWVLLLLLAFLATGCGGAGVTVTQTATFDQLLARPIQYNDKMVTVDGFYFHGFEVIVLSEKLVYSGHATGHLIPRGEMIWIEGGIPIEVYDNLYQQRMMGPTERYGKVRITGKFQYGGTYGHLDSYTYQITPSEVELLSWSPPE